MSAQLPPPTAPEPPAPGAARRRWVEDHFADPLYRTSYLLILASGTTAVLGFVFWILAARSYPARVVGINSAAISAMMFVSGVCQLGLPAVLVRYVPTAGERTGTLVARSYAATAGLALVLGAAAALSSEVWSPALRFLAHDAWWLAGFTLATVVWTVFTLQDGVLTGLRASHWVAIENSLFSAMKLVLLVALSASLPVAGLFVAWNVPAAVAVVGVSALLVRRLIPAARRRRAPAGFGRRRLLRLATGNYAAQLFGIALIFLMPVIVADVRSATTTAYFYAPWTIASAIQLVAGNTASSLTVEAALNERELGRLCRRTLVHTLRLVVPVAVIVAAAAPLVLRAYGPQYAHAGAWLLRLLAVGAIPNAVVAVGLGVARVQQRGRLVLAIQAGEAIPLLAAGALLLGPMGIAGVGVAYLVSQILVAAWVTGGLLRPLLRAREGAMRPA